MARPNVKLCPGWCFAPAACLDVFWFLQQVGHNGVLEQIRELDVATKSRFHSYMTTLINHPDRKIVQWRFGKKTCSSQPKKLHRRRKRHPPKMAWSCLATNARPSMKMNMSWHRHILTDWICVTICECKLSYVVKLVHLPRLTIFYRQNRLPFKFHSLSPLPFCFRTPDRSNVNLLSGAAVCAVAAGRSRQKVQRKAKESRTRRNLGAAFFGGNRGNPKGSKAQEWKEPSRFQAYLDSGEILKLVSFQVSPFKYFTILYMSEGIVLTHLAWHSLVCVCVFSYHQITSRVLNQYTFVASLLPDDFIAQIYPQPFYLAHGLVALWVFARTVNPATNEPEDPQDFPKPSCINQTASWLRIEEFSPPPLKNPWLRMNKWHVIFKLQIKVPL